MYKKRMNHREIKKLVLKVVAGSEKAAKSCATRPCRRAHQELAAYQ